MSSSVHQAITGSRGDSLSDREVTGENVSVYMTPAPETPYETPNSTPRLIHCRLKPVKTIRQHVPLKINFSQDVDNSAVDQAASNKFNEIKPISSQKVRCILTPNPSYRDSNHVEAGDATYSKDCHIRVPSELHSDERADFVNIHCHSRGDGEIKEAASSATSAIFCNNDNQQADNLQSVAVIEKEIQMMDMFVKNSIKRLQNCCDDKDADICEATNSNKDNHKMQEKTKNEKVTVKHVPARSTCLPENHDLPSVAHKCEKKKFYDPKDIRKYMMKKKNERQAKEKEERHKKETEAMALKRKAEVAKIFAKTRIPVPKHHNMPEHELDGKFKNVPKTKIESTRCSKSSEELNTMKNQFQNEKNIEHHGRYSKSLSDKCNSQKSVSVSEHQNMANGKDKISGHECNKTLEEIDDTEKYFTKKFNDIITKCAEEAVSMTFQGHRSAEKNSTRRISSKIKSPEKISKRSTRRNENSVSLPEELDVLKSKNPYNFLNILKGKVNLVKNSNDVILGDTHDDHLLVKAFPLSPPKKKSLSKSDKDAFLENILERRMKLGNSIPLTTKLNELKNAEEYENVAPVMTLKSELTLDDLNLSPPKPDQTYLISRKKNDKTFILNDNDINDILSKNAASSLELSGIKSLSASDDKVACKLSGRDNKIGEGGNVVKTYDDVEFFKKLGSLSRTLSLESLKAHNVSLSLPDSLIGKQDEENNRLSMKNLSMDLKKLMEDESIFGKGYLDNTKTSTASKLEEKNSIHDIQKSISNDSSAFSSDTIANLSTTAVFFDIYDQMMKSEDEKLSQILKKIHQQKEALNKYLKTEVYALESKKKMYRENDNELDAMKTMKMKMMKQRQRAILLKITKNIQELDKMKKSVIETVEKRKMEILRQKNALIEKKESIKQKLSSSKKKKTDDSNRIFLVSKQTNTLFMGVPSSSDASMFFENVENRIEESEELGEFEERVNREVRGEEKHCVEFGGLKDTATSPVHFNSEISIRLELDPEKLLKMKSPRGEIKIDATKLTENLQTSSFRPVQAPSESEDNVEEVKEREKIEDRSKMIKIKRPLSPVVFPANKKVSQIRRLSSSSDVTFASLNDTTTDQSDVELRISALQEQLRQRKMEAERLRREEKQLRKEKLRAKEQSLLKQLEAYDQYIQRVTKMLSEDTGTIEVAKPQIKQTSKRPSFSETPDKKVKPIDVNEKSTQSQRENDISTAKIKNYIDDVEAETNTEDSEKHLRKADSGILMESEVTEVSENIEIRKSKSESEIHSEGKSERESEKIESEVKATGSKSVDNFLKLIDDIQSEVVSMSEQVYSSDFVEDITEDLPDNKSEISNDLNTSISIEEILSDAHYRSDTESKADSIKRSERVIKEVVSNIDTSQAVSPASEPTSIQTKEVKTEESNSPTGLFVVKNISDIESLTSNHVEVPVPPHHEDIQHPDSIDEHLVKEEMKLPNSEKNIEQTSTDEVEPTNSFINTISERFSFEEIKSASSLETPMTEIKESSMLIDYSPENNADNAANTRSVMNHEFVKYESEASSVPDVDEPVRKMDDIETMMDGFQSHDFTLTDETISEKAQKNFEEVLKNLESYFSVKISPVDIECSEVKSLHDGNAGKADFTDAAENEGKSASNLAPLVKPTETGLEETDISESLEYDTTSAENSDARYKIEFTLTEKKRNEVTDINEDSKLDENTPIVSEPESGKSNGSEGVQKKSNDEFSAEEDRSVEEFLEDYSMPNLMATTFIVNEDDDANSEANKSVDIRTLTPSPVKSSIPEIHSENSSQGRDEDLDHKITMDQTPFLQALRRESESFFGTKSEKLDEELPDVLDKLVKKDISDEVNEITKSKELDVRKEEKVSNALNEADSSKTNAKVDESFLEKHVSSIGNDWFDKELSFNRERLREAEELRLQQIRIEQEIEELQAQQHIPPYLYIREIPNKPPPPYTPPSEHNGLKIPNNEIELRTLTGPAIQYVCNSLKRGLKIDEIKQLPEYSSTSKSNSEVTTYKKFIFHLTKEVARNILESNKTKTCLPWENLSKNNKPKILPSEEELPKIIENEILILFGFKSKISKEKLIIQWSRKKRNDFVDDLLIRELQEEEAEWTNYEEDENIIKNQITQNLLDDLIQDTVDSLNDAFNVKNKLTSE